MRTLITATALSMFACQKTTEAPAAAAAPAAPPPAAAPVPAEEVVLKVEPQSDGTLKLTAKDRWGAPIDTVYESLTFLENAVPTLERGLTPEQTQKLKAEVQRLKEMSK